MFGTCLECVPNVSSDTINFSLRAHPTTFDHLLNVVTSHFSSYCTTSPPFHTLQRLLPYISLGGSELRRTDEDPRTKLFHRFFHPNYAAHRFICPIIPPPTESRLPNSEAMQSQHPQIPGEIWEYIEKRTKEGRYHPGSQYTLSLDVFSNG
jgi:hypothetical protein